MLVDTFANRLLKAMNIKNIKQIELHEKTGIDKTLINKYLSGNAKARQDKLTKLSNALEVNEAWLMGYDVPMDRKISQNEIGEEVIQIPVYGKISAGKPAEMIENIIDYVFISADQARKGSYFGLEVIGDSMNRIIPNGSRVIVRKQEELENGEIGVIAVNGYDATVKRYECDGDNVYLYPESNNPEHKIQRYSLKETPISILGKVESYNKKL